jgi:hypothetical protein
MLADVPLPLFSSSSRRAARRPIGRTVKRKWNFFLQYVYSHQVELFEHKNLLLCVVVVVVVVVIEKDVKSRPGKQPELSTAQQLSQFYSSSSSSTKSFSFFFLIQERERKSVYIMLYIYLLYIRNKSTCCCWCNIIKIKKNVLDLSPINPRDISLTYSDKNSSLVCQNVGFPPSLRELGNTAQQKQLFYYYAISEPKGSSTCEECHSIRWCN